MPISEALKATPRVKSIQRAALAMLVVAGVINYVDRATLAVANPLIREDLGLSIADMGYLLSAFLWAYAFAQLPTGAMVDKLGPRMLLTLGLSALVARAVARRTGARLRPVLRRPAPARHRRGAAISDLRARGAGLVQSARPRARDRHLQLRLVAGHRDRRAVLTFLMLSFGWRTMFMIMGVAGLVMAAVWYLVYRNPTEVALTAEENALSDRGRSAGPADQGDVPRMEAVVPLPDHLGHDFRLFRLHLSDLDLHRLAARLSRDRAAHERQVSPASPRPSPSPGASSAASWAAISPTCWCAAASRR